MIRSLATASLNGSNKTITLYRRFTSCSLPSCRTTGSSCRGYPRYRQGQVLLTQHCNHHGIEMTSSIKSSDIAGRISSHMTTVVRMLSDSKQFSFPGWSQPAYQENFIDGPMMPREPVKKKKKKKKKPEKIIPPMDSKEQCLEKMRIRFDEIEKEHLGPNRGIRTVKWIAGKKCEGIHKTVTTKMANSILNSWVYCRHALLHGHYQLNDMTKKELAESLLGKGTKTKVPPRDSRLILKELFRFGTSSQLDRYMKEHLEKMKMMGRAVVAAERNRIGTPKIRNLATVEEMAQHGYTQLEIDEELLSRMKKDDNRRIKKIRKEMPAYLRHEVSGARRQEARKIERILRRKEKKRLLRLQEYEARFGPSSSHSLTVVRGEEDTDMDDDDSDDDSDDDDSDDYGEDDEFDNNDSDDDDDDDDDDEESDNDKALEKYNDKDDRNDKAVVPEKDNSDDDQSQIDKRPNVENCTSIESDVCIGSAPSNSFSSRKDDDLNDNMK